MHVPGWPPYTTQAGDLLRDLLDQMGADVTLDRVGLTVEGSGDLYGIDADLLALRSDQADLGHPNAVVDARFCGDGVSSFDVV